MAQSCIPDDKPLILEESGLQLLLKKLIAQGYLVLGPVVQDQVIAFHPISSVNELRTVFRDVQTPGHYHLEAMKDGLWFGYSHSATPIKRWLFPPKRQLWRMVRKGESTAIQEVHDRITPIAFIGLRACDLKSIEVLDRVLTGRAHKDLDYAARRASTLLIAVNCASPSAVCFCSSMGAGPRVQTGFDLCLTELLDERGHRFIVQVGSEAGRSLLSEFPLARATKPDMAAMEAQIRETENAITKELQTKGLQQALYEKGASARWSVVAKRCLACGNCTMSCPTCFCCNYADDPVCGRTREWDTCFHPEFSGLHGGSVRHSISSRYRQWLTHKLATWHEQFGMSGCVGCGRCITWCPAGIDITEEAKEVASAPRPKEKQCRQ